MRRLLDGLQNELDRSWAVLGELFSRSDELRGLGIRLRRVRSNLDEVKSFREEVKFIPGKFSFESAGTSLLKKLVGPLYGDRPVVGIRELIQNAIDSINERLNVDPATHGVKGKSTEPAVIIKVEGSPTDGGCLTIEDFGSGMTEEILRDYFLKVGASFRDSDAWRRSHIHDGKPDVLRSGRFGVGVLASFLLGERVEVTTRHFRCKPDEALHFVASIDDEAIEIIRTNREKPGTTIRIQLSGSIVDLLSADDGRSWDWYRWNTPRVDREINGRSLPALTRLPEPGAKLDLEWHRLKGAGFDEVVWTFGRAPHVVCNGLNIGNEASSRGYSRRFQWEGESNRSDVSIPLRVPSVSVTDREAKLPVDLQRFALAWHRLPFAEELLADVTRDFCAYCLTFAPTRPPWETQLTASHWRAYPGREVGLPSALYFQPWYFTHEGSGPLHRYGLTQHRSNSVLLIASLRGRFNGLVPAPLPGQSLFVGVVQTNVTSQIGMALSHILGRPVVNFGHHTTFSKRNAGTAILLPSSLGDEWYGRSDGQIDLRGVRQGPVSSDLPGLAVWFDGSRVSLPLEIPSYLSRAASENFVVSVVDQPDFDLPYMESPFTRTWGSLIPGNIIPYDEGERRRVFATAYKKLQPQIDKWESLRGLGLAELSRRFDWDRSSEVC